MAKAPIKPNNKVLADDPIKARKLQPGEVLFKEGDKSSSVFIITSGLLRVFHESHEGRVHLADLGEKQIVGEMALLAKRPRSASVEAVHESVVLELEGSRIQSYFEKQPPWFKALIESLVMRIRSSNDRLDKMTQTLNSFKGK